MGNDLSTFKSKTQEEQCEEVVEAIHALLSSSQYSYQPPALAEFKKYFINSGPSFPEEMKGPLISIIENYAALADFAKSDRRELALRLFREGLRGVKPVSAGTLYRFKKSLNDALAKESTGQTSLSTVHELFEPSHQIPIYLRRVIERTRYIETPGSRTRGRAGFRRELDQVFVQLTIVERVRNTTHLDQSRNDEAVESSWKPQTRERQIDLEDLIRAQTHFTISGDPGSGKSTLLAFIARQCAQRLLSLPSTPDEEQLVPILLRLPLLANQITPQASVIDLVRSSLSDLPENEIASVLEAVRVGKAFLLLDGFDEMAEENRLRCNDAVRKLVVSEQGRENRIVLAGRATVINSVGLFTPANRDPADPDPTKAHISPMSPRQRRLFVEQEFLALGRDATPFLRLIEGRTDLAEITGNPLLLSITVQLWLRRPDKGLPEYRAPLYLSLVGLVLDEWKAARDTVIGRASITPNEMMRALSHVAARMLGRRETVTTTRQLATDLAEFERGIDRRHSVIIELIEHSGFLDERGIDDEFSHTYGFLHQTYLEFFAALYLVRFGEANGGLDGDTVVDRLRAVKFRSNWQVALCLAFGFLADQMPEACEETCRLVFGYLDLDRDAQCVRCLPTYDGYEGDLHLNFYGLIRVASEGPLPKFASRPDVWRAHIQTRWSAPDDPDSAEFYRLLAGLVRRNDWCEELCRTTDWVTQSDDEGAGEGDEESEEGDTADDVRDSDEGDKRDPHTHIGLSFIADVAGLRPVDQALRQIEDWLTIAGPDSVHGDPHREAAFSAVHKLKERNDWTLERACEVFLQWSRNTDIHRAYAAEMLLEGALQREDSSTLPLFGKRHQFHYEDPADLEKAIQFVSAYKDGQRDFMEDLVKLAEWNVEREPFHLPFGNDAFSCLYGYVDRPDLPVKQIVDLVARSIQLGRPGITQGCGVYLLTQLAHRDDLPFSDGIGIVEAVLSRPVPKIDWDNPNADTNAQGPFAHAITLLESLASKSDATLSQVTAMVSLVSDTICETEDESSETSMWQLGESNTPLRVLFEFGKHSDCPPKILAQLAREGLAKDDQIEEYRFVDFVAHWATWNNESYQYLIENLDWGTMPQDDQQVATELLKLVEPNVNADRSEVLKLIQKACDHTRSSFVVRLAMNVFERLAHSCEWSGREILSVVLASGRLAKEFSQGDSWYEGIKLWDRLIPSAGTAEADVLWDDFESFCENCPNLDCESTWEFLLDIVKLLPTSGERNYLRELRLAEPLLSDLIYSRENESDFRGHHVREFVGSIAEKVDLATVRPVVDAWVSSENNAQRAGAWFILSRIRMSTSQARHYLGLLFKELEDGKGYFYVHTREALKHLAQIVADGEPLAWLTTVDL